MVDDDPFGEDADRTILRPRPGRARAAAVVTDPAERTVVPALGRLAEARAHGGYADHDAPGHDALGHDALGHGPFRPGPVEPGVGPLDDEAGPWLRDGGAAEAMPETAGIFARTGVNPLARAAAPLFALIVRLKSRAVHRDVPTLRQRVIAEIRAFERRAAADGVDGETLRAARYAVAATVDDVVLNTPWGGRSIWTGQSMVSTFYNETWGGERFFDILDRSLEQPARHVTLLELMYLCLSLGFEGRYRVDPAGAQTLGLVRDRVWRAIRQVRDEPAAALSPHWQGLEAAHRPLGTLVPLWLVGVGTLVLLVLVFAGFRLALDARTQPVLAAVETLPPTDAVVIARTAPTPPPLVVTENQTGERLRRFLEPEIREGLVTVLEDAQSVTVRLNSNGLFASASDTVLDGQRPTLDRIGQALEAEPGRVQVVGHTDSQPISTIRFPNNTALSVARAEAVVELLAKHVSDPGRFTVEGRAAAEPIADNATAAGRAQNRRIEIILMKTAEPGPAAATTTSRRAS